jgi:RNA polymerase sigma factor (sigma-70 family)
VGYAFARLGDFALAEDAAQEAFLEAHEQLPRLREPAAFSAWFRRIVLKQCDRIARKKQLPTSPIDEIVRAPAVEPEPEGRLEERETARRVRAAVAALGGREREVVLLFYFAEHSLEEIADFLDEPIGTVKSRLHAARRHLEESMVDHVKDAFKDRAPSRDESFANRVLDLLRASAAGDHARVAQLTDQTPTLATASGPHPHWGGEPQSLQVAVEWGQLAVAELLLDRGADPDATDSAYDGWTPLHLAIHRGHDDIRALLLARGASIDPCAAAALAQLERLEGPLAAHVHARGPNDATPLHFAATVDVARALLAAGAGLDATDKHGNTPNRWLAWYPARRPVARFLLHERGREPDVFLASALGDAEAVRQQVQQKRELLHAVTRPFDAVARLSRGATALHVAAIHGHADVVTALLDLGASIDARCADGTTALHQAAAAGRREVVELLLHRHAPIDAVEPAHESTALGWAEFHGRTDVAALLRAHGARA